MSIFLDESKFPIDSKTVALHEGIISWVKRFYSGKDDSQIEEFSNKTLKAKTKDALKENIKEIEETIKECNSYLSNSHAEHFMKGGFIRSSYASKYKGNVKNDLQAHINKLKKLLTEAKNRLSKVK